MKQHDNQQINSTREHSELETRITALGILDTNLKSLKGGHFKGLG